MKKQLKMLESSQLKTKVVKVDLDGYCVWDEEDGTLINHGGMRRLINVVAQECQDLWLLDGFDVAEHDESLFLLYFSRKDS